MITILVPRHCPDGVAGLLRVRARGRVGPRPLPGAHAIGYLDVILVWTALQQLEFFLADGTIDALRPRTRVMIGAASLLGCTAVLVVVTGATPLRAAGAVSLILSALALVLAHPSRAANSGPSPYGRIEPQESG